VNCIQAQVMLAAYRDLKNEEVATIELDAHLEQCASCRQALARYNFIGEQVRSLPVIEPPPGMHASLMHALANEQLRFIQRSAPDTVSTPAFLKPYLTERVTSLADRATTRDARTHIPDTISSFSTAETGPLPVIQAKRKPRPGSHVNQFAVLGIAAMFLMLLMMGGITSLLLLAHGNIEVANTVNTVSSKTSQSLVPQSDLTQLRYTISTPYSNVVSAIADDNYIYYTAYSDGTNSGWMLEKLDRSTKQTTDLLPKASTKPLVVLSASNGWLVWLQFDDLPSTVHSNLAHTGATYSDLHAWSLDYLALPSQGAATNAKPAEPVTLLKGIFNRNKVPSWVSTPVQGIWFIQDSLLVAIVDDNGISHLLRYNLSTGSNSSASMDEIATAPAGAILTSPTANSDASNIFWAQEWLTADGNLHSNIWIQSVPLAQTQSRGKVLENTVSVKELYRSDGLSFRPQVVNDTLFLLSASPTDTTGSTSGVPIPATILNIASVPRVDNSVYAEPLDNFVQGTVIMIPLDGDSMGIPALLGAAGQSSGLQGGNNFVLWQENDAYKMYDAQTSSDVTVGDVLNNANFIAVNGDTTVWTVGTGLATPPKGVSPSTTLLAFNWAK